MKVVVAVASKYGATREIGREIATTLAGGDFETEFLDIAHGNEALPEADGYVIGSAVYMGHWLTPAADFIGRHQTELSGKPVWLFSSGPIGEPLRPTEDAVDVSGLAKSTAAIEHQVFAGKLDKSHLNFAEKALLLAFHVQEGDFRDWDAVLTWASSIADRLAMDNGARGAVATPDAATGSSTAES